MPHKPVWSDGKKRCHRCREYKVPEEFGADARASDGYLSNCTVCTKAYFKSYRAKHGRAGALRFWYGLTIEQYDAMFASQGGVCAVCREPETATHRGGKPRHLAVDHDHDTGQVRGLLCSRCNTAIGLLREDESLFQAAISYLARRRRIQLVA